MLDLLVGLATALGIPTALYQLWLSRGQARASFEQQFVARYWAIEDERLSRAANEAVAAERYLRLCEDQYEWMRLGEFSWRT